MKRNIFLALLAGIAVSCAPSQKETLSQDSTIVAVDTVVLNTDESEQSAEGDEGEEGDGGPDATGSLSGDEYFIAAGYSYISDPFDFSLDSATIQELLGEDAIIKSTTTPAGEDEMGSYESYSFYEVSAPEAKMSFYSYSGKHYADVTTPKLTFRNGVVVGMLKADFIAKMKLPDEAVQASTFTINDDYGSMSFYFEGDKLTNIHVSYEEGD